MKRTPAYLNTVPNTDEGWNYIRALRTFLKGRGFYLKLASRNPNRKQFYKADRARSKYNGNLLKHKWQCTLPQEFATTFDLYFHKASKGYNYDYNWDADEAKAKRIKRELLKVKV